MKKRLFTDRPHAQRGVTLIELLVVLVIIAILAAAIVPNFFDVPDKARVVRAKQDVRAIENAMQLYRLDNYKYPESINDLIRKPADAPNWKQGGYLERLPKDPWETDYQYRNPGEKSSVDIYSLGADRAAGGDGVNKDVGNWDD